MRIFLVGGTVVSRRAISTLLQTRPEYEIAGNAATIEELNEQLPLSQPELVLLNGNFSIEAIEEIVIILQSIEAKPSLLLLSGQSAVKGATLAAGVDKFVLRGDPPKSLLTAVETIRLKRQDV